MREATKSAKRIFELGFQDEGIAHLSKLAEHYPSAMAYFELSKLLMGSRGVESAEATAAYSKAIDFAKLHPFDVSRSEKFLRYCGEHDFPKARQCFEALYAINPSCAELMCSWANVLGFHDNMEAVTWYHRALDAVTQETARNYDTDRSILHGNLAFAYVRADDIASAATHYKQSMILRPNLDCLRLLTECLNTLGREDEVQSLIAEFGTLFSM